MSLYMTNLHDEFFANNLVSISTFRVLTGTQLHVYIGVWE